MTARPLPTFFAGLIGYIYMTMGVLSVCFYGGFFFTCPIGLPGPLGLFRTRMVSIANARPLTHSVAKNDERICFTYAGAGSGTLVNVASHVPHTSASVLDLSASWDGRGRLPCQP